MRLALLQTPPLSPTLDTLRASLEAAKAGLSDVLIVPELYFPGYNQPEAHRTTAEPRDGPWMSDLRAMAQEVGCGLVFGWAERAGDAVFNAATCVDAQGEILSHYRKVQLFGKMERASFQPGTALGPIFELCGRKCGLLICYDIEFPGHINKLSQAGAEVVFVPTANPKGFEHVQEVLVPARAHEARGFVAYANYCGTENGLTYGGGSVVAGPDGRPLAKAGEDAALLIVDLPALSSYPAEALSSRGLDFTPVNVSTASNNT